MDSEVGSNLMAAASRGKGKANGDDLSWSNTRVEADDTLTLNSGGDTALKGAVAAAERVVARFGGDLAIESLQDVASNSIYGKRSTNKPGEFCYQSHWLETRKIMKEKILKTCWLFRSANGDEAVVFTDGDKRTADVLWGDVKLLQKPTVNLGIEFWLENNERIRLPFKALASILPDKTGALILFEPGQYTNADRSDVFPEPNNAAIYNADGSLRFQLMLPEFDTVSQKNLAYLGWRIGGVHTGVMPEKYKHLMGVVVATHPDGFPEWVYAVDPTKCELIKTGQWVRW